jgi:hypothetical protein
MTMTTKEQVDALNAQASLHLVSIVQILLRSREQFEPTYKTLVATVSEVERQLALGLSYDVQAMALVELARRYGVSRGL